MPVDKVADYKVIAEEGAKTWMECGALEYYECQGDDLTPPSMGDMKALSFPELTNLKDGETVWFSFITFQSREHRDEVNKKVMEKMGQDAEKHKDFQMPFDMKRVAYGGFKVEASG